MQGLKDIKPWVEVPDHSLLYLLLLLGGVVLLLALLWWFLRTPKRRRRRRPTRKELAKQSLENLDFSDTKEAVYTFSEAIQELLSPKEHRHLKELLARLEIYKYKKKVPTLSQEDKEAMQTLIKESKDA